LSSFSVFLGGETGSLDGEQDDGDRHHEDCHDHARGRRTTTNKTMLKVLPMTQVIK
jgi:hypothetical protein